MNTLLLYFKEEYIELWSLDNNGRIIPVLYNSSNQLPLYFLISGDQILMDDYAKNSYLNSSQNSFGNYWNNLENDSLTYERFNTKNSFASLLPYVLKEDILPYISKSHFHTNLSSFLNEPNTVVLFDSFVDDLQKEIILKLFFEIIGFSPNSLLSIDFFECFRKTQTKKQLINQNDSFIFTNISDGNLYFHLIGKNSPLHLSKKILEGKGQDPVLDIILDFLVELAQAKGSMLNSTVIKKEFKNEAKIILNKLPNGLVIHTITNNNIDVSPLKISFHKNDIEGRINNRQSLNYIQNEFDSFRRQNNAEQLPIFLSGKIINQTVFRNFFNSTYSKINFEEEDFDTQFILNCLNIILLKDYSTQNSSIQNKNNESNFISSTPINIPPVSQIPVNRSSVPSMPPPVVKSPSVPSMPPPVVKSPPVPSMPPPVVKSPPVPSMPPPVVKSPPVPSMPPPVVRTPPAPNLPPPVIKTGSIPPPPPPLPPNKK